MVESMLDERREEAGVAGSVHEKPPRPTDPQTASTNADAGGSKRRAGKVGPPVRSPSACKSCGRSIKSLCIECLTDAAGERMRHIATGVLRSVIKAHGPITANFIGSAAKRIGAQWQAYLKQRNGA